MTRTRATGVVMRDGKVLLIRRINKGEQYFVLPGGGLEEGESIEECLTREMKEETCIEIKNSRQLFEQMNEPRNQYEHYFLIKEFLGEPKFGEEEHYKNSSEDNRSYLEWHTLGNMEKITNIYPEVSISKLITELKKEGI